MKSCSVRIERFGGVQELEAPDGIAKGDPVICEV
jgi:hypothetical protein